MPNMLARRAEEIITAKVRRDAAGLGPAAGLAEWGRTVAFRVPALRHLVPYNKARGVNADDLPHLTEIRAFFADAGIVPALEVWTGDADDRLGAALARAGHYAGTVAATLHRHLDAPLRPVDPPPGATVEEVGPDDPDYLPAFVGGYGWTGRDRDHLAVLRVELDPGTVRRYLARVHGRPAAAAALFLSPSGALLSGAATLPAYRNRGLQTALISRRLSDAAAHTDLAVVTTAFASPSHANLSRAGFQLTHTRTTWRPLEGVPTPRP